MHTLNFRLKVEEQGNIWLGVLGVFRLLTLKIAYRIKLCTEKLIEQLKCAGNECL